MEVIIPPRDHRPSAYRYTWDDNGEVSQIQRQVVGEHRALDLVTSHRRVDATNHLHRVNSNDLNTNRQTVQWPFQDVLESETGSPPSTSYGTRRATWQPAGLNRGLSDASSRLGLDVIPDYVVNYIRGETPETLAQKKKRESDWRRQEQEAAKRAAPYMSRATEHENWLRSETSLQSASLPSGAQSHDEQAQILPSVGEKEPKGWKRLVTGWRGGILLNIIVSFFILVVGFVCLILAISKAKMFSGGSPIYEGSCRKATDIEWGIFAVINLFVVVLIAGANYVFQVLSSPTRVEVAVAHDRKKFLDIGMPSLRNMKHISNTRVFVILGVVLSAVITQIIYNSVIFVSQTAVAYDVLFVAQPFLQGAQISNGTATNEGGLSRIRIQDLQARASQGKLTNLTSDVCLASFSTPFQAEFDAVILVTDLLTASSSLIQTAAPGTSLEQFGEGGGMAIDGHSVLYCLAQPSSPQSCAVTLNGSMLGIVALLNLISVVAVALALFKTSFEPLVTLGDAIASFLEDSDPSTRGSCLMTKSDVYQGRWGLGEAKYWVSRQALWFSAPSIPAWFVAALVYLVLFGLAVVGLAVNIITSPTSSLSAFGMGHAESALILPSGAAGAGAAVLSALPQILLSVLYFSVNGILTMYFLSHEFSQLAVSPRTLRVSSSPKGAQTTSLFLTLPRPYSWALLLLFATMGFVLSQSVFVMHVTFVASTEAALGASAAAAASSAVEDGATVIAVGTSGVGLMVLLILLAALAALVLNLGFRKPASPGLDPVTGAPAANPLVLRGGSCSAVIAARCQRLPTENGLATRPGGVTWGVIRGAEGMNVSHCGFGAHRVTMLKEGSMYA